MKTSMKILAASVVFAMSGAANAAILQSNGTVGSGELFMTAWDMVGQQSYALDLGILQRDFLANPSMTLSYDLSNDANFAPFLNNSDTIYAIAGGDDSFQVASTYGVVITSSSSIDTVLLGNATQAMIGSVVTSIDVMAGKSNTAAGDVLDPSLNLSGYAVPGDTGYAGDATWSVNAGGSPFVTTTAIDNTSPFYFAGIASDYATGVVTELPNVWLLTSTGQLTYAPVSAVPVPAAVWLFGSGLLGLVSVARRRKA